MELKPLVGSDAVFHSALDKAASLLKRNVGTGMEFMQELGKIPGVKKEEIEDRKLHEIMGMPKMTRDQFLSALQSRPVPQIRDKFFDEASDVGPHHKQWALSPAELYHELVIKAPKNIEQFPGVPHHFGGEPGILASMLLSFTKDANTKADALHLDELQSDWHQKGREGGYGSQLTPEDAKRIEQLRQISANSGMSMDERAEFDSLIKKREGAVPDAPFKKNWEEMALKRLLQYAADEVNTDGITISTGKILNDRWGLKKHVDELFYDPDFKTLSGKKNGRSVFYKRDIPSEELEKYIGKDVAKRMLEKKPNEEGLQNLSGLDLEIQNQAMQAFYDKKIPNILNNIGKKYGVKTQLNAFKHVTKPATATEPEESVQLHYFPITDEMRKDIRENGLPLYAEGGEVHMAKGGSTIKNIQDYIRQREGEYGLKRLQRAADEIPGLDKMYTEEALRRAFSGDNAQALMTMNPADFEKFALRLGNEEDESSYEGGMTRAEYIARLAKIANTKGFSDVPFLEINRRKPEYLPSIEGHEGRHRSRALEKQKVKKGLVQLFPNYGMREGMPRRYREDFIEAMKKELGEKRLVTPEGRSLLPADLTAMEHQNLERRGLLEANRPQLPEIYKDGGSIGENGDAPIPSPKQGVKVNPSIAQMKLALATKGNPLNVQSIGANEAPSMSPKTYLPPDTQQGQYVPPGGAATPSGMPVGGIDMNSMQPGNQLMPGGLQPPQPQQPQQGPQAGPQQAPQPGQPQQPQGGGNILQMTPQGRAMAAISPNPPQGMADGGSMHEKTSRLKQMLEQKFSPQAIKASEALGQHEGKTLHVTQSDRTKVGGGFLGGPGFSSLQHVDPDYANLVWGVNSPGAASRIINVSSEHPEGKALWSTMIGAPTQHSSNQMVFSMLLKEFKKGIKAGKLKPETRAAINQILATSVDSQGNPIFGNRVDISGKNFFENLNTFDKRRVMADLMGGVRVGGKKGQVFDYDKIIQQTTEPELLGAPTHAIGPRLFTATGERSYRPELHPAFPHMVHGEDLGVMYHPVPKEVMLPEFHEKIKKEKGRNVGYMDLTRNVPSQFLSENFLTQLQKRGYKKGGNVNQDTMLLELAKSKKAK